MILKILLIAFGLGITIFVHELGHFIMARRAGVRVETFSLGFGPVLWTFFKDKKGTRYILSLVPLGGYVKMLGQEDMPSGKKEDITPDHYLAKTPWQRIGIITAGVGMNLVFAYLLMIVALWIGIDFMAPEVGGVQVGTPAAQDGGFKPGDKILTMNGKDIYTFIDVKTNVALSRADKEFVFTVERDGQVETITITPQQSDAYNELKGMPPMAMLGIAPPVSRKIAALSQGEEGPAYAQGLRKGMEILSIQVGEGEDKLTRPELMMNFIAEYPGEKVTIEYRPEPEAQPLTMETVIEEVEISDGGLMLTPLVGVRKNSPADQGGMQTGDIITAVGGKPVKGWQDISKLTQALPPETESIAIEVSRKGELVTCAVKPYYDSYNERFWLGVYKPLKEESYLETLKTITFVDPSLPAGETMVQAGDIYVGKEDHPIKNEEGVVTGTEWEIHYLRDGKEGSCRYAPISRKYGTLFSLGQKRIKLRRGFFGAFGYAFVRYVDELKRMYVFLGKLVTGRMSPKMIGGPVQIANVSYKVFEFGFGYFLYLFSLIGISLAVINILPIPVLDGGILAFLVYEIIRGKPASEKVQIGAQYVGLGLLLMLIVFVTFNDIARLIS